MVRKAQAKEVSDADEDRTPTAGRGIWSGSISFGLLQIPVKLYTAEKRDEEIHFHQLDKDDLAPVKYQRVSSKTGRPIDWKDIVKGYEYEPKQYVVIESGELEEASAKATQTLDIQDFVPADQISSVFFETPYYLVPQKRSAKAYVLLREALKQKKAVAVATFVLRTKEHLAVLLPVGNAIMLEVLRYGHELRQAKDMPLPKKDASISDRELAMARQLIDGMMTEWDPSKYKDRYRSVVLKMIAEKAKTGAIKSVDRKAKVQSSTDVIDLVSLLKQSLAKKVSKPANDGKAAPAAGVKKRRRTSKKAA